MKKKATVYLLEVHDHHGDPNERQWLYINEYDWGPRHSTTADPFEALRFASELAANDYRKREAPYSNRQCEPVKAILTIEVV